ncbi:MAG TPA: hypothetical protein VH643_36170 [Gemmataceae bacterium]|jgi:hypothetical protein
MPRNESMMKLGKQPRRHDPRTLLFENSVKAKGLLPRSPLHDPQSVRGAAALKDDLATTSLRKGCRERS